MSHLTQEKGAEASQAKTQGAPPKEENGRQGRELSGAADQSVETPIGDKTAEELLGDILASSEQTDDNESDPQVEPGIIARRLEESTQTLSCPLNLRKFQPGQTTSKQPDSDIIDSNKAHIVQDRSLELLSPSRVLSCSKESIDQAHDDEASASENPFEVVVVGDQAHPLVAEGTEIASLIIDGVFLQTQKNSASDAAIKDQRASDTAQRGDGKSSLIEGESQAVASLGSGANEPPLLLGKQRSSSAEVIHQSRGGASTAGAEKAKKRRKILPIMGLFASRPSNPSDQEALAKTQAQPPTSKEPTKQEAAATQASTELQSTGAQKEKRSMLQKIFFINKGTTAAPTVEEQKAVPSAPHQVETTTSSVKTSKPPPSGPQGFGRILRFLQSKRQKESKQDEAEAETSPQEESTSPVQSAAVSDEGKHAPESSLDVGFRENLDENQYKIDICEGQPGSEEGKVGGCDQAETTYESDDTEDEIYKAHEGVDFRPTAQEDQTREQSFAFSQGHDQILDAAQEAAGVQDYQEPCGGEQPQQQRLSNVTTSSAYSQRATYDARSGNSIGSFQAQQLRSDDGQQRIAVQIQPDEWEAQFPGAATNDLFYQQETSQPFQGQGNHYWATSSSGAYHQPPFDQYEHQQKGQYRHSAGFLNNPQSMAGLTGVSSSGAHTTATGSHPALVGFGGTQGSDQQPFSVTQTPFDDHHNGHFPSASQLRYPDRHSGFVPKRSTASGGQQATDDFFRRNPRSLSNSFMNGRGSRLNNPSGGPFTHQQMRISAPFTPSQQQAGVAPFNPHGASMGSYPSPSTASAHYGPIVHAPQHPERYSAAALGSSQQRTLNLAMELYAHSSVTGTQNRPSAPFPSQGFQQPTYMQNTRLLKSNSVRHSRQPSSVSSTLSSGGNHSSSKNSQVAAPKGGQVLSTSSNSAVGPTAQLTGTDSDSRKRLNHKSRRSVALRKERSIQETDKSSHGGSHKRGVSVAQGMSQAQRCVCCSSGSQKCLLEHQLDKFNHLAASERMKNLILADQKLQHFHPIDLKKNGGQSTNQAPGPQSNSNARAGIEGRIKDDICHECCACCTQMRNTLLFEMKGIASELCRDQLCSKFIQVQLSRCPSAEPAAVDMFIEEIVQDEDKLLLAEGDGATEESEKASSLVSASESLMRNVFGNYVMQLVFERGSEARIDQLYDCVLRQITRLSFDQFGCRIIQKALVWLPLEKQLQIVGEFSEEMLVSMMYSEEGNYIIQCMILNLPVEHIQFFVRLVEPQVLHLCKDKRGCRVIQRMLEKFPRDQLGKSVVQPILQAANELTPQQYGNYVITHILQNGLQDEKIQVIDAIMDNILRFSLYQLGSNVVENCLKTAPPEYKDAILERIVSMPVATPARSATVSLANLLENQFGNYVVQHAFNMSGVERKRLLYEKIERAATEGNVERTNTYAKHVFTLIENADYRDADQDLQATSASVEKQPLEESKKARLQKRGRLDSHHRVDAPPAQLEGVEDDDQDQSNSNSEDEESGLAGNAADQPTKKRRKRRRKRGTKKKREMLFQEDVLAKLSDSDRLEYLSSQNVQHRGEQDSLSASVFAPQSPAVTVTTTVSSSDINEKVPLGQQRPRSQSVFVGGDFGAARNE